MVHPQPAGVRREALGQPHVLPAGRRHGGAEPLVRRRGAEQAVLLHAGHPTEVGGRQQRATLGVDVNARGDVAGDDATGTERERSEARRST